MMSDKPTDSSTSQSPGRQTDGAKEREKRRYMLE
jgi:hypothetical protein